MAPVNRKAEEKSTTGISIQRSRMTKSKKLDERRKRLEELETENLDLMKEVIPLKVNVKKLTHVYNNLRHTEACKKDVRCTGHKVSGSQQAQSRRDPLSVFTKPDMARTSQLSFPITVSDLEPVRRPLFLQAGDEVIKCENTAYSGIFGHPSNKLQTKSVSQRDDPRTTSVRIHRAQYIAMSDALPIPSKTQMDTFTADRGQMHLPTYNDSLSYGAKGTGAFCWHPTASAHQFGQAIKQEPIEETWVPAQPCARYAQEISREEERQKQFDLYQDRQQPDQKSLELERITAWLEDRSDIGPPFSSPQINLNETLHYMQLQSSNESQPYYFGHHNLSPCVKSDIENDGEPSSLQPKLSSFVPTNAPGCMHFTAVSHLGHQNNFQTPEKQTALGNARDRGTSLPRKQPYKELNRTSKRSSTPVPVPFKFQSPGFASYVVKTEENEISSQNSQGLPQDVQEISFMPQSQFYFGQSEFNLSNTNASELEISASSKRAYPHHAFNRKSSRLVNITHPLNSVTSPELAHIEVKRENDDFSDTQNSSKFLQVFQKTPFRHLDDIKSEYNSSYTGGYDCKSSPGLLSIELSTLEELLMD